MNIADYIKLGLKEKMNPFYVKYLSGKKLLDIGCGRGEFLAREPENFTGADIDPALVKLCNEKGLKAQCMSALKLEFQDNSFDVVYAAQLIEHFAPPEAALFLKEAGRVLKPGGIVYLTTPGVRTVWNTFSHIRPYPPDSFVKILNSATENYIRDEQVALSFEKAWGGRFYSPNRTVMFLLGILDLLFPPRYPMGWTIILRKK